jgi:hypothetical protein
MWKCLMGLRVENRLLLTGKTMIRKTIFETKNANLYNIIFDVYQ